MRRPRLPVEAGANRERPAPDARRKGRAARGVRLLAVWTVIAGTWLLLLPYLAERPAMQRRLAELEAEGIDPSAMFYSELGLKDEVIGRLEDLHRRRPEALWRVGKSE